VAAWGLDIKKPGIQLSPWRFVTSF
jgi:hypothetical protein